MKDYWLAKLIDSVTEVDSRKRLQKAIYLLQLAGCPLQCEYILHYYGPYSFELAGLIDQLKGADIIDESPKRRPCYIEILENLNDEDPWVLELAATIAYFYEGNWAEAQKQTETFKKLSKNDNNLKQAFSLAKSFKQSA